MSYDPDKRRDTPLARQLKQRIAAQGPISITAYMHACLQDPEYGYYIKQPAIGAEGDFITAPEISQIFGELMGLWAAIVWQQMGTPTSVNLIELGPGRGTLLADALRAAKILPGFTDAMQIHLIESNQTLAKAQRQTLKDYPGQIHWHQDLTTVPSNASILIANEYADTIAVDQLIKVNEGWRDRGVGLDERGDLCFCELQLCAVELTCAQLDGEADIGAIKEVQIFKEISNPMAHLAADEPLAALFLDYGHMSAQLGDSLQAVRHHRYEHPLTSPGEADLTAHVDFTSFAFQTCGLAKLRDVELAVDGPVLQAQFLGSLGITERAAKLMSLNPPEAGAIEAGIARLLSPQGMGGRFKAIGFRSQQLPPLPGFAPAPGTTMA